VPSADDASVTGCPAATQSTTDILDSIATAARQRTIERLVGLARSCEPGHNGDDWTGCRQNANCESETSDSGTSKEYRMPMSNAIWLAVGAGITIVAAIVRVVRTRVHRLDPGSVSDRWVAAHRVESGHTVTR
jgi:hypothetical protein